VYPSLTLSRYTWTGTTNNIPESRGTNKRLNRSEMNCPVVLLFSIKNATAPDIKNNKGIRNRLRKKLNSRKISDVSSFFICQSLSAAKGIALWKKSTPRIAKMRNQSRK
jgi:hypothetical protein